MVHVPKTSDHERPAADALMQALYAAHARPLYRFLLGLTFGERQAAESLLQETMLRAWRKLDDLDADVHTLRPWLITVARQVAIDAGLAGQVRPAEAGWIDMSALPSAEQAIGRTLAAPAIKQALIALSPQHRGVLIEIYYRGRTAAETAAVLGIPEEMVKSRTYHALRELHAVVGSMRRR